MIKFCIYSAILIFPLFYLIKFIISKFFIHKKTEIPQMFFPEKYGKFIPYKKVDLTEDFKIEINQIREFNKNPNKNLKSFHIYKIKSIPLKKIINYDNIIIENSDGVFQISQNFTPKEFSKNQEFKDLVDSVLKI